MLFFFVLAVHQSRLSDPPPCLGEICGETPSSERFSLSTGLCSLTCPACPDPVGELLGVTTSFTFRTSGLPLRQHLYNPHLQNPLGSADSKRLTATKFPAQPLYSPHLRDSHGCAGNKGLATLLESALTRISTATPLESALTNNGGGGVIVD